MGQDVAQQYQNKLPMLKRCVEESYKYFKDNYDRYHKFMRFVYDTSLSSDDVSKLIVLKKPNIEFNILEAYINRRVGEFAKHEPNLQVRAADGLKTSQIDEKFLGTVDVVESHIREIMDSATNDGLETNLYKDTMGGGFSVAEVYTDYLSDLSFEQCIKVERVFDPTLCGFDPLARESHKGDGQYCFKIIPRTKEDFEEEYGKDSTQGMTFARDTNVEGFSWSYNYEDGGVKLLLEIWFYRKERKKEKIAKLSNGHVILKRHYDELVKTWNETLGRIEQAPIIIEERWSQIESIELYKFCENKMLHHQKTNYKYLPLVFIDGNSSTIKRSRKSASYQMTRPYVYQAEGVQRLKNFAGQSMASEIETMVQHKFMVAIEAIPSDYIDAYTNPQQAQVLAYNAFYDKNPELPLPAPQVIQRSETPSIVQATFEGTDRVTQTILGSFDAQQGIVGDKISGKAIEVGSMQSDAAAVPYLENYIKGLNRIGQIILDLIPKYYLTPRSIPIKKSSGLRDYQVINDPTNEKSIDMNYDPNSLQIKIEAGVNSSMQKQYAINQIVSLMGASELFAEFMNSDGLEILLDNIEIRGVEQLKLRASQFMQAKKQAQEASAGKPDPLTEAIEIEKEKAKAEAIIEFERIKQKKEEADGNLAIKAGQLAIDEQKAHTEFMKMAHELKQKLRKEEADMEQSSIDTAKDAIQLALEVARHHMEMNELSSANLSETGEQQ